MEFVGTAISVAKTGALANPLLRAWAPQTAQHFFLQPPLHPVVLGWWLRLFGISTASLASFQLLILAVAGWTTSLWVSRLAGRRLIILALSPHLFILERGLRNDALGFLLLSVAILWAAAKPGPLSRLGVGLSCGLAPLAWPATIAFAVPLFVALVISERRSLRTPMWMAAGGLLSVLVFLALIDFELSTFLRDLSWHASEAGVSGGSRASGIRFEFFNGWQMLLVAPFYGVAVVALARGIRRLAPGARPVVYALLLGIPTSMWLHPPAIHFLMDPLVAALACASACAQSAPSRKWLLAAVLGAAAYSKSYRAVEYFAQDHSAFHTNSPETLRAALKGATPVVDEIAARFLFDYRLPADAIYWDFSQPGSHPWPATTSLRRPDEVWIVGLGRGDQCEGIGKSPRVSILGRTLNSMALRPWDLQVVR